MTLSRKEFASLDGIVPVLCSGMLQYDSRPEHRITWLRLLVIFKDLHARTVSLSHFGQLRILSTSFQVTLRQSLRYSTKHNLNYCQCRYIYKTNNINFESCALQGCYAASSANSLPTLRDNLSVPSLGARMFGFLIPEDGTRRLSRNVGKELTLLAAESSSNYLAAEA